MKKPRNIIGGQLQKIRHEKGISQSDLCAASQLKGWDISRFTIAKIESGSRCVADFELILLAELLEIETGELFPSAEIWASNRNHFMKKTV